MSKRKPDPRKISSNTHVLNILLFRFSEKDSSNIATKKQQFSDSCCSCANTPLDFPVRLSRYIKRDIVISSSGKHDFY